MNAIRKRILPALVCAMVLLTLPNFAAESKLPLKNGDRVIFFGDSITQAGAGPNGYITRFRKLLAERHADLNVEVIGAGISGNRVPDLEKRLDRDVLSKKPSVVVIYIGINDVWHSQQGRGTPKDEFESGLKRLVTAIQKSGARVVICTPSVIGEKTDGTNSLDKMLDEYCVISREVAAETKSPLLDLREAFRMYLRQHNPQNAEKNVLTTDGVHLNDVGNQFVAEQMMQAFESTPSAKVLRHVVAFKFKSDATPDQVQEVVAAFRQLPGKIPAVQGFEWGTDVSPEMLADGFTNCFFLTFADAKNRDTYLHHAAHQEFVELVKPRLEKAFVIDYWAQQ